MKHVRRERPSASPVTNNGEQNHPEMFGAIGLTRGRVQTTTNVGRVNRLH
jgi:hypothetical protein